MDVDSDGSTSEDDQQEQEEDTVLNYDGGLSGGLWHGRGTATYASGTTFRGRFCRGLREGRGVTEFHGVAEFPDGSKQSGRYVADKLEGSGRYDFPSGESLAFCYVSGTMHGPWEERGADGSIRARGEMEDGRRVGLMEVTYADGGQLRGSVDEEGNLGGDDCVYTYPDRVSRLHGRWEPAAAAGSEEEEDEDEDSTGASGGGTEHRLCSARFETDLSIEQEQVQVRASGRGQLSATELRQLQPRETFEYDTCRPGSAHRPSARPLLRDPYEAWRVEVRPSPIGGHTGEGLFARRALASGEVAAFYSGSRIHPDECDAREWSENDNVMSINEHTAVDVAPAWVSPSKYCASLGHKVNHSFTPNARFEPFSHPRFGEIKCVRATEAIEPGCELVCHYDYHMLDSEGELAAPEWYKDLHAKRGPDVPSCWVHRVYSGLVRV